MQNRLILAIAALFMAFVASVSAIVIPQIANAGISGAVGNGPMVIQSGTYTPTIDNLVNVSTTTVEPARYTRVGDVVRVSGRIGLRAASSSYPSNGWSPLTSVDISLPIPTATLASGELTGVGVGDTTGAHAPSTAVNIDVNLSTQKPALWFYCDFLTTHTYNFRYEFSYMVE